MLVESIALAIFVFSFGGILLILVRKIPVLNDLPRNGSTGFKKHQYILEIEQKIKEILGFFKKQIFLHKFLSWVKVMILKIETKIDALLHGIRKKAQKIDKELKDKK